MNGSSFSMYSLPFLQCGVIWFLGMGFVYTGSYIIGARKSGRSARTFHRYVSIIFLVGAALLAAWGLSTGEMQALIATQGLPTLLELIFLGLGWVAMMWFLSAAYANEKAYKEELAALPREEN